MRQAMAVLAGLVLLPGCADILGMCGPQYFGAQWTEPGLFDAVDGTVPDQPRAPSLPFDAPHDPDLRLVRVTWRGNDRSDGTWGAELDGTGAVSVQAYNRTPAHVVEARIRMFLENVTAAPVDQVRATAAQAAGNAWDTGIVTWDRNHVMLAVHQYNATVPGPYRLQEAFQERAGASCHVQGRFDCTGLGRVAQTDAEWVFWFDLPVRAVALPDGFTFEVDSRDRAAVAFDGFEENEAVARARIVDGLARAGVQATGAATAKLEYAIC